MAIKPGKGAPHVETAPEQRLISRITRLTLVQDIVIGICLVLLGVLLYDVFIRRGSGFHIATPGVDELLLPLLFILQGVAYTLWWRGQVLRSRLPGFQRNTKRESSNRQRGLLGPFVTGLGCFMFVSIAADLPSSVVYLILIIGSIGGICLMLGFDWYLSQRAARRAQPH
jgi:hypothetical protein